LGGALRPHRRTADPGLPIIVALTYASSGWGLWRSPIDLAVGILTAAIVVTQLT